MRENTDGIDRHPSVGSSVSDLSQNGGGRRKSNVDGYDLMSREELIAELRRSKKKASAIRQRARSAKENAFAFFENLGAGAAQADGAGRFVRVNRRFCEITGYSREELLGGMKVTNLSHPDDLKLEAQRLAVFFRGAVECYDVEKRYMRKDGGTVWVRVLAVPIFDEAGQVVSTAAVIYDISGKRQISDVYQELLEAAPDAMLIHDEDGIIQIVNAQTEKLLGYTKAELLGQSLENLMPERYWNMHEQHVKDYAKDPHLLEMCGGRLMAALHKDGHEIPVEVNLSPMTTGPKPLVICAIRDVTQHQKAQAALQASEERLRIYVERTPASVAVLDREMRYVIASQRWIRDFNLPMSDLRGVSHYDLFPDLPDRWKAVHQRCLAGAIESSDQDEFPRADGTSDWLRWEIHPWRESDGQIGGIIIFSEVITDRVKAAEALRESQRFVSATLDAVPANIAVLDEKGNIISTNVAWHEFAMSNEGSMQATGVGQNYIDICMAASGDDMVPAANFAKGIRAVLSGDLSRFSMEYPCHSKSEERWYVGYVTPFKGEGPSRAVVAHLDITARKRAEQALRRMNEELEKRVEKRTDELLSTNANLQREIASRLRLEQEILEISEREQQRIGRDLHDDLGQQLAGTWCMSEVLEKNLAAVKSPRAADAAKIANDLSKALALTRSLSRGLHPVAMESDGLMVAFMDLAARTSDIFSVKCCFKCAAPVFFLDNKAATHLFRIAQEAVTNAVKHGAARNITIDLTRSRASVVVQILDDGSGFPPGGAKADGMGLRIMKYRADMIGAQVSVSKRRDGGIVVTCTLPNTKNLSR